MTRYELYRFRQITALQQIAALGTVTRREAAHRIRRPYWVVSYWSRKLGLTFADGHQRLIDRLACYEPTHPEAGGDCFRPVCSPQTGAAGSPMTAAPLLERTEDAA